jgi:hypothetical protein
MSLFTPPSQPSTSAARTSPRRRLTALVAGVTALAATGLWAPAHAVGTQSFDLVTVAADGSGPSAGQYNLTPLTMSGDARYVAFRSDATTLVAGDTNGQADIFVRDRQAGTTVRANITSAGVPDSGGSYLARISASGRSVAFLSYSSMVPADTNSNVNYFGNPDPNSNVDAYIRDLDTGVTEQVSVGPDGSQGNSSAGGGVDTSSDGRFVAFGSSATNWAAGVGNYGAIWLRDRQTGTTSLVKAGDAAFGGVGGARISDNGSVVAFVVSAPSGRNQLWAVNRATGNLTRVDVTSSGAGGNGYHVSSYDLSADGNLVAFQDDDSLVASDTNGANYDDVYVRDLAAGTTRLASLSSTGAQDVNPASEVSISGNGRFVGWTSWHNIGTPGWDAGTDVYVHDLIYGSTWHVGVDGYGTNAAANSVLDDTGEKVALNAAGTSDPALTSSQELYVATRTPDTAAPSVFGYPQTSPNPAGWYRAPVQVSWSAYDPYPSWGAASTPAPTTASIEGTNTYTSDPSCDQAGHCATGQVSLSIDLTDPSVAVTAPADGTALNYGTRVRAAYTCTDAGSGIAQCTGTVPNGDYIDTSVGQHTLTVTGTDIAGRTTATTSTYTVNATVPSAPSAVSAAAGNAAATVSWSAPRFTGGTPLTGYTVTASPGGSTVTAGAAATSTTVTGPTNGTSYTFTVKATNSVGLSAASAASNPVTPLAAAAAPTSVSTTIDPAVGGALTTDTSGTGATAQQPLVTTVVVPAGVTGDTISIAQTTSTAVAPTGYSFFGQQVDITAPVATASSPLVLTFRIDPVLAAGRTPSQIEIVRGEGTATPAVVADCLNPSAEVAAPDPCVVVDYAADGSGDIVITVYTSHASHWNFATAGDTTAPTITVSSPTNGTAYTYGQAVPVTFACADESGGSGVRSCTGTVTAGGTSRTVTTGASVDTRLVGAQSLTVTATDNAGNRRTVTTSYSVVYPFTGFFAPVAPSGLTSANAGSTVPMTFALGGDRGTAVLAATPLSYPVSCSTLASLGSSSNASGSLSYDRKSGRYTYTWPTAKSWAGSCRTFALTLTDGTTHRATFRFVS